MGVIDNTEFNHVLMERAAERDPMRLAFARDLFAVTKRATVSDVVLPNGLIVRSTTHPRGIGLPSHTEVHITDVLIDQATELDDRFKDIPTDLLKSLSQAAFQLGVDANG